MDAIELQSINNENLFTLFHNLNNENIVFFYQGPIRQKILEETTEVIKGRIDDLPGEVDRLKYILLFIEVVQNIIRYSSNRIMEDVTEANRGMVLAGFSEGSSFIVGCNPVKKKDELYLRDNLPVLKNMSRGELNKRYKAALHDRSFGREAGGAGLGLIDIFRKAKNVEYSFSEGSENETLYLLRIEI
jgi:hypothetical protein